MIKTLFYTLSLITLLSCQNKQEEKADSNSQNIEQANLKPKKETKKIDLEKVDYKSYCGKTLGELLENETLKNYEDYYFVDEPPFILALTTIEFPNTNKILSVYIGDLVYQKTFNSSINWSFDLLKKEKFKAIYVSENDSSDKVLLSCDCRE